MSTMFISVRFIQAGIQTQRYDIFLIGIIMLLIRAYIVLCFVAIIMTWIPLERGRRYPRFITELTQPVFEFVRQQLPFLRAGMIDFSPMVVFMGLELLHTVLLNIAISLTGLPAFGI